MKRKRIAGRKGRVKNNNLILKKQLQNTNIISIRKVYLMVWCIELVNFHSKCKMLGGVAEFFSEAFLCRLVESI